MIFEKSYGIIPLRKENGKWQVLLVNHVKGNYWGFPKGHANPAETNKETAQRELFEETGLSVKRFFIVESLYERYDFYRGDQHIDKEVFYFPAEADGDIHLQTGETQSSLWIDVDKAEAKISFPQSKTLAKQLVNNIIPKLN